MFVGIHYRVLGPNFIHVKNIYEPAEPTDGLRVLVEREWPKGIRGGKVHVWFRELGPSEELARWFTQNPSEWADYETRYRRELGAKKDILSVVRSMYEALRTRNMVLTLLYATTYTPEKEEHNNAAVLEDILGE